MSTLAGQLSSLMKRRFWFGRTSKLRQTWTNTPKPLRAALVSLLTVWLIVSVVLAQTWYIKLSVVVPKTGGNWREGLLGQPTTFNPLLANTETDQAVAKIMHTGLYRLGEKGEIVPSLATSMPMLSADGKQYTVTIASNARWHDNAPVTAKDVEFSITSVKDEALNATAKLDWSSTTVNIIGDRTLVFILSDVNPSFIWNLTLPIIPEHIWSAIPKSDWRQIRYTYQSVGAGPFQLDEVSRLSGGGFSSLIFRPNPKFLPHAPYLKTVRLSFFDKVEELEQSWRSNNLDAYASNGQLTEALSSKAGNEVRSIPGTQLLFMFFQTAANPVKDKRVRLALAHALESQAFARDFGGKPLAGIFPPEQVNLNTDTSIYNPAAELDAAGWKLNANKIRQKGKTTLSFELSYSNTIDTALIEKIVAPWRAIGAEVILRPVSPADLRDNVIRPREFVVSLFSLNASSDPDPFLFWHSSQIKAPGLNISGYNNKDADRILTAARNTTDLNERQKLYQEFNTVFMQDPPAVPLTQSVISYAVPKKVSIQIPPLLYRLSDRLTSIYNWHEGTTRKVQLW